MLNQMIINIKRHETPFYTFLYRTGKAFFSFSIPTVPVVHKALYNLTVLVRIIKDRTIQSGWSIPVFRSRCSTCGVGLKLPDGIPYVEGSHLKIHLGNNVTIMRSTIASGHVYDEPQLVIGNNSTVGFDTTISVGQKVEIGNNVLIAANCFIADNDGHPADPERRSRHESVTADEVKPVVIGNNVWLGNKVVVLKGVTIGDNAIVGANSVVMSDVKPGAVVMGNPARTAMLRK